MNPLIIFSLNSLLELDRFLHAWPLSIPGSNPRCLCLAVSGLPATRMPGLSGKGMLEHPRKTPCFQLKLITEGLIIQHKGGSRDRGVSETDNVPASMG